MYTHAKRLHMLKDPVVHVKSLVDCGNAKITRHALKATESIDVKVLKLDTIWKKKKSFK